MWELIAEPRTVTALTALVYTLMAAAGVIAIASPPVRVADELGGALALWWGAILTLGGALGVIGAIPGWWYAERAGLIGVVAGLGMYSAALAHISDATPSSRAVQILAIVSLVVMLVNRWLRIAGATLDPSRGTPSARTTT